MFWEGAVHLFKSLQIGYTLILIFGKITFGFSGTDKVEKGKREKKNYQRFSEFLFICFQIPVLDMLCII